MTERPLRIERVLETCLYATDVAGTARFYRKVLGLEVVSSVPGRHVFFRLPASMLLLFAARRTSEAGEVPPHGASGPGHVAFAVEAGHLARWRRRFAEAGVPVEREITWPGGGKSLYVRDPAGNSVELATPDIWGLAG